MRSAEAGRRRKFEKFHTQYDFMLLFMTVAIAMFGVLMIYSASSYTASTSRFNNPYRFVTQQLLGLALGIVAMIAASKMDYQWLLSKLPVIRLNLVQLLYMLALVLQTIVLIPGIGQEHNGARRWLKVGPAEFQPSEITKIAVILFISYAVYKSRRSLDNFGGFVRLMIYIMPLVILIAAQNLSTAIIVAGIAVGMCFVASKRKNYFIWCGLALFGLAAAYALLGGGFRAGRIEAWLDVENSPNGFQILQGLYAIASGGLFGSGLGQSMQKLGYIPEAYNDMIFAVICEELGIVGAVIVMMAFLVLLWRIVLIACNAPDIFGSMLCIGVMIHIAIQVILNIAVVTNSIPSTGVPLPLISYGGTASAIMMAEMGLVLGVSNQVKLK
ncbi:MAG: FtsW/RodA/SpoVE family cell cycle protein [Lachnospiraceae bacterium]|nr:FtsW/RodA/SpoVE family cell cycle protein [Lachnospiraceae bacterium]